MPIPRHLVSACDLGVSDITSILDEADAFRSGRKPYSHLAAEKVLALLFFEPSTRTRFSFEVAFKRLGGGVIGFTDPSTSAMGKGETLDDSIRIIQSYADLMVIRHADEDAVRLAANYNRIPVINAGNGIHEHPTQALLDLYTIRDLKGGVNGLQIAVCGDLKHGRDIHSLALFLARYKVEVLLVAPPPFGMPDFVLKEWKRQGFSNYSTVGRLEDLPTGVDVLYLNRIQRERLTSQPGDTDFHALTEEIVATLDPATIILNPLPRSHETPTWFDTDPRAKYFEQAANGVWVRMGLFSKLLVE